MFYLLFLLIFIFIFCLFCFFRSICFVRFICIILDEPPSEFLQSLPWRVSDNDTSSSITIFPRFYNPMLFLYYTIFYLPYNRMLQIRQFIALGNILKYVDSFGLEITG